MRKYPAGGVAPFRAPVKGAGDVVLGGGKLVIPEGAILHAPIAAIQLSPALWDNPEKFDPARWLQVGALVGSLSMAVRCVRVRSSDAAREIVDGAW